MKIRRLVSLAIVSGLLLALIMLVYSAFSAEPPYTAIILNAIELRNVKEDQVSHARLVANLDRFVEQTQRTEVKTHWQRIVECLPACQDDTFFDLIAASAIEGQETVPNAKLVTDLIVANRFWGAQDVVEFSRALAAADETLSSMRSKLLDRQWDSIVACNGTCADKDTQFFDLIRIIVSQEKR